MRPGEPVTVYGAGSWGTTLALVLAGQGVPVLLWARDPAHQEAMRQKRENTKYLPGIPFPGFIHVVPEVRPPEPAGTVAVLAVPSHALREVIRVVPRKAGVLWIIATKGLEEETGYRMSQIVGAALRMPFGDPGEIAPTGGTVGPVAVAEGDEGSGPDEEDFLVTLAGPSLAREVAEGKPTAVLAASRCERSAAQVQALFATERFRVYRSLDPVGVELATSLKNGIALAAGIAEGLDLGGNTLGALLTRGLAEITRLGVALGAQMETFLGLAGVGDLVTTCTSSLSRNHQLGRLLASGLSLEEALAQMTMVAEGVRTTRAAVALAEAKGVEVPILAQVEKILFHQLDPAEAIDALMTRPLRAE